MITRNLAAAIAVVSVSSAMIADNARNIIDSLANECEKAREAAIQDMKQEAFFEVWD